MLKKQINGERLTFTIFELENAAPTDLIQFTDKMERVREFYPQLDEVASDLNLSSTLLTMDSYFNGRLQVIVGTLTTTGEVVGCIPFAQILPHSTDAWWFLPYQESCVALSYPVDPEYLQDFMLVMPPHHCNDISIEYASKITGFDGFFRPPTNTIMLPKTFDEYLSSLKRKDRQNIRRNLKQNEDIVVEIIEGLPQEPIESLLGDYKAYWDEMDKEHNDCVDEIALDKTKGYYIHTRNKIDRDFKVIQRINLTGSAFTMLLYLNGELIGVNIATCTKGSNSIDDYICIRSTSDEDINKRHLGVFVISKMIEWSINNGYTYYNLCQGEQPYKRKFISDDLRVPTMEICNFHKYSIQEVPFMFAEVPFYFDNSIVTSMSDKKRIVMDIANCQDTCNQITEMERNCGIEFSITEYLGDVNLGEE